MNESVPCLPRDDLSGTECQLCTLESLGREVIVKQHIARTSRACHTRWLGGFGIEIGRQIECISPVLHCRLGACPSNLIGCCQIKRNNVTRVRLCILHTRSLGRERQLLSRHSSLTPMHERWRDRQSLSGFLFPVLQCISSLTVEVQVPVVEGP